MADIPVQPKRAGTPWWLWLVALVALAALVWLAVTYFGNDRDAGRTEAPGQGAAVLTAAPAALALSLPLSPFQR